MPRFSYTAKQGPRKIVEGTVEATHFDEALVKISQLGLTPLDVRSPAGVAGAEGVTETAGKPFFIFDRRRVTELDLMLLTRKASDLVDAGVPVLQMLRIIQKQERRSYLKEVMSRIFDRVKDGSSLSDAMAQHDKIFPRVYVNMIRAGEMGGNLDTVLGRLADLLERDQEARAQVKSSLVYPAVILGVALLTITGIFSFVIPRIMVIFEDLNQELPWPTKLIMGISYAFQHFGWAMLLVVIGAGLYIQRMKNSLVGKMKMDRMALQMPMIGDFIRTAEVGRFARSLGTLLDSGVTVVKSLEAVAAMMDNDFLQTEVQVIAQQVSNGASLTDALRSHPIFPETAVGMIAVGEESGHMAKGLYKLADYYERQTQRAMKRVTSLIEPALILFLGVIVAFILVGTLLPILKMNLMVK